MITTQSGRSAIALAMAFAEQGKVVAPREGRLLQDLVRLTNIDDFIWGEPGKNLVNPDSNSNVVDLEYRSERLNDLTKGTLEIPSDHSNLSDRVIKDLAGLVTKHISHARTVVKPVAISYTDKVKSMLQAAAAERKPGFNIVVKDLPELIKDSGIINDLENYSGRTPYKPETFVNGPVVLYDDLIHKLVTGDKDTDALVAAWFAGVDHVLATDIWNSFFVAKTTSYEGMNYSVDDVIGFEPFKKLDALLIMYLGARRAFSEVPENDPGVNLAGWQAGCSQVRDFAAAELCRLFNVLSLYNQGKTVVLSLEPRDQNIYVYGENYRTWLDEGGTPEVLFGMLVEGRLLSTVSQLNDNSARLLTVWKNNQIFAEANETNRRFAQFKEILLTAYWRCLEDRCPVEQAFIEANPGFMETQRQWVETIVNGLNSGAMDNVDDVCLLVICRGRFHYTGAETILGTINTVMKNSKSDIDPREAALVAATEYLAKYLASMMYLKV